MHEKLAANSTADRAAGPMEGAAGRAYPSDEAKSACVERNRTWAECGLEEKVERIRRELLQQREVATFAATEASKASELAHDHLHAQDGRVMKPAQRYGNLIGGQAGSISRGFDPLR